MFDGRGKSRSELRFSMNSTLIEQQREKVQRVNRFIEAQYSGEAERRRDAQEGIGVDLASLIAPMGEKLAKFFKARGIRASGKFRERIRRASFQCEDEAEALKEKESLPEEGEKQVKPIVKIAWRLQVCSSKSIIVLNMSAFSLIIFSACFASRYCCSKGHPENC